MTGLQKAGGAAALLHSAAYVVSMVLGAVFIFPILEAEPSQYLAFVVDNQTLLYLWNLIGYWGSAVTLVVMVLALCERVKTGSRDMAQTATVFGLIWATLIIGSGNLMLRDVSVIADLYGRNPAQVEAVWLTLDAVETGIVSGNEVVGGLWVLLLSLAALRAGEFPRVLNYLGVVAGAAGILTLIPALTGTMSIVFALGMILWGVWVGIAMLNSSPNTAAQQILRVREAA